MIIKTCCIDKIEKVSLFLLTPSTLKPLTKMQTARHKTNTQESPIEAIKFYHECHKSLRFIAKKNNEKK